MGWVVGRPMHVETAAAAPRRAAGPSLAHGSEQQRRRQTTDDRRQTTDDRWPPAKPRTPPLALTFQIFSESALGAPILAASSNSIFLLYMVAGYCESASRLQRRQPWGPAARWRRQRWWAWQWWVSMLVVIPVVMVVVWR